MDNFEINIRHKLDDAELTPPKDMWSRVEAQLPKENKRRGLVWMMWLLPLCLMGGVAMYYINTNDKQTQLTQNAIEPPVANNGIKLDNGIVPPNSNNSNEPVANQNPIVNSGQLGSVFVSERPSTFTQPDFTNTDVDHYYNDLANLNYIKSLNLSALILKNELPIYLRVKPYQAPIPRIPGGENNPKGNKNRADKPCRFVFESVNNFYYSGRTLKATSNASAEQEDYVKLRNNIEYGKVGFSGGIAVKYCISKNFMVGTGIRMTIYKEDLIYNKREVNVSFEAPPIGIDEKVKKKYPYMFTKQTDSIYAGQNYYGGTNRYHFKEVPLTFGYYHYGKKYNFYGEPAISYCRISYVKASLLDLDHVGFTTVNQIDGYEGVSHIFNASIRVGGGINLTKSFSINAGFYASRAITPLIKYTYAKQLPYTCGITLGFEQRL